MILRSHSELNALIEKYQAIMIPGDLTRCRAIANSIANLEQSNVDPAYRGRTKRVVEKMVGFDLVNAFFERKDPAAADQQRLRTRFPTQLEVDNASITMRDIAGGIEDVTCETMAGELDRQLIGTLRHDAAAMIEHKMTEGRDVCKQFGGMITEANKVIHGATGHGADWVVIGAEYWAHLMHLSSVEEDGNNFLYKGSPSYVGTYAGLKLYVDPLFPPMEALVGAKPHNDHSHDFDNVPFLWSPYIIVVDALDIAGETRYLVTYNRLVRKNTELLCRIKMVRSE